MKLLALDISTHTGWALFDGDKLVKYGKYDIIISDYKAEIKTFNDYPKTYPENFIIAAYSQLHCIREIIKNTKPDLIVIEETNKGTQRFSQKVLEWMHFVLVEHLLEEEMPFTYLTTRCWRVVTKCFLKDWPQYKKYNGRVGRAKRKAIPTKAGAKVAKIDGKIVSSINQKKLSVILVNQAFGLNLALTDNDIADAINLGRAALVLKPPALCLK